MGKRGDRGDGHSDDRSVVPKLQVLVYDLDVGQG